MRFRTLASVLAIASLTTLAAGRFHESALSEANQGKNKMYGLIAEIHTVPGQRAALVEILIDGVSGMRGCLSYVVAKDPANENTIWVTEVWENKKHHAASLSLPSVQEAITKGGPLMVGFGKRVETEPAGGHGISPAE